MDIDMQDRLTLQGLDFNSKAVKQGLGLEFQGPLLGMWISRILNSWKALLPVGNYSLKRALANATPTR